MYGCDLTDLGCDLGKKTGQQFHKENLQIHGILATLVIVVQNPLYLSKQVEKPTMQQSKETNTVSSEENMQNEAIKQEQQQEKLKK